MTALPRIEPAKLARATLPFNNPEWVFELKHDGFRAVAYVSGGECDLVSRRKNSYKIFSDLRESLTGLRAENAILDGEIVCLDSEGRSIFNELLRRKGCPAFYAFDLLWLNGRDLRHLPLVERKKKLRKLIRASKNPRLLYAEHVERKGQELFQLVCERNLEGIVAKRKDAQYSAAANWLKIRNPLYTQTNGRRELFESFHR